MCVAALPFSSLVVTGCTVCRCSHIDCTRELLHLVEPQSSPSVPKGTIRICRCEHIEMSTTEIGCAVPTTTIQVCNENTSCTTNSITSGIHTEGRPAWWSPHRPDDKWQVFASFFRPHYFPRDSDTVSQNENSMNIHEQSKKELWKMFNKILTCLYIVPFFLDFLYLFGLRKNGTVHFRPSPFLAWLRASASLDSTTPLTLSILQVNFPEEMKDLDVHDVGAQHGMQHGVSNKQQTTNNKQPTKLNLTHLSLMMLDVSCFCWSL